MAERKFEAKERTVNKMTREGLTEESLASGASRRVSKRTSEVLSMKEGDISTDAGAIRHSLDASDNRRKLYAEKNSAGSEEQPESDIGKKQRHRKYRQMAERGESDAIGLDEGSPEGGIQSDERSFEDYGRQRKARQRGRAERYREAEEAESDRREKPLQSEVSAENSGDEGAEEAEETLTSEHSARMEGMRGHSAAFSETSARSAAELRHDRNKKQVQKYAASEKRKKLSHEDAPTETSSLSDRKDEIVSRQKKERYNQEQRKQKQAADTGKKKSGRLSFDDEDPGGAMVHGSGMGIGRRTVEAAAGAAAFVAHSKVNEAEDENSGVEAAHAAERLTEDSVRRAAGNSLRHSKTKEDAVRRKADEPGLHRLRFGEESIEKANAAKQETEKKTTIRKFFQKQRYRRMYAAAKKEERTVEQAYKASQNFVAKAAAVVKETFRRNSKVFIGLGILGLLFMLMASTVTSCTAVIHGTGSSVISTTYASTDAEIHNVENAYKSMENALNAQINSISSRYPGYDDFRYQIDEISHNPYHLTSYFTVKYGEFTLSQVRAELEEIFHQQYEISTQSDQITVTHTKMVRVGESLGHVVTSGYCSCPICCGQWSGGPTASGVYPTSNHTIAVDANDPFVPIGTHVVMNGVEYVVEDTGAFARYGVQFDVYYDSHSAALNHGHRTWEAYLADSNGRNEIQVTTTETVNRLSVTLTNKNLDVILRSRMTPDEIKRYDIYNRTFGNRNYLFDLSSLPGYGPYNSYTIPPEALSDERFARMIREAEKYLGYPYVWGGSSPSTSFDCSGFVSWVVNNCGNGWSYGRLGAEGLRQVTAYVYPEDAMPGDLIFFQGTYDCGGGASHCGIYVGDGMMIHCGNPIQYTSINSAYWQAHFLQFGRLP